MPPIILDPPPSVAFETAEAFQRTIVPARDLAELTSRYKGLGSVPTVGALAGADYTVGDTLPFWFRNDDTGENEEITAVLVYRSDVMNLWFEEGASYDKQEVEQAAAVLEEEILPTVRTFFGQELTPGIDGDPRIQLLHLERIGGTIAGYFSAADEFVSAVNAFSNEKELLYISLEYAEVGSEAYFGVIAHEYQHMIHWATDANETSWLNEGLSELAAHLNGYTSIGFVEGFAARTDTQLNNFMNQGESSRAHYGASFLFAAYFLERFGEDASRALVRHPENGPDSVQETLDEIGSQVTFDELVGDWLVANYLDGSANTADIYQYQDIEMPEITLAAEIDRFPTEGEAAVHQYGADYLEIRSEEPVTLVFTGTRQTRLIDATAHSGSMFWSSYNADNSDVTLTGRFDLSGLERVTLSYWTWYELETGWDYGYLAVSADEGLSWELLETTLTTLEDPQGNSYGPGFTGNSGGGETPVWVQDRVDLSAYAGQEVLVRFEVITDEAIHLQGFVVDDIAIAELDYLDDVEDGDGVWEAAGFVRHANVLPQTYLLQLLLFGPDGVEVQSLTLEDGWNGRWAIPFDADTNRAIVIVAGNTPVTTQTAGYRYNFIKAEP